MTTAQNTQVRVKGDSLPYPILTDGTGDINAGDMVYWVSGSAALKAVGSDANAAFFAGIAKDTSFLNITGTKKYLPQMEVLSGGIFALKTTNAETYNHGTPLYAGADAQTITTVAGSNIVGYAWLRPGQGAVTGAAGVTIDVLIAPKFPAVGVN